MALASQYLYAGWIVVDVRLLIFVGLISLFLCISVISLFVKNRRWHEYATVFVALYSMTFLVMLVIFNWLARYPVFEIKTLFPFP